MPDKTPLTKADVMDILAADYALTAHRPTPTC
jgi:hypothetical protein